MYKDVIKNVFEASPASMKTIARNLLIPPLRAYFRYAPCSFGKKTLWAHLAAHLWWLESYVKAKTIFGSAVCADAADIVGRYIYYFGVWEPNLTNWISGRLLSGDAFVDVGANIGYYSLLASKLVGESGKVVAVEALPQIFTILRDNLQANCAGNVRPVNIAAWDRKEEFVTIFTRAGHPSGTTTLIPAWANQWRLGMHFEVPAAPLAAILEWDEIKAARLIKIDVEGAEWHVVSGMTSLLRACRKDLEIIIEVAPKMLEAEGRTCQEFLAFFSDLGFYPYRIENDYSATAYFAPRPPTRPQRIEQIPTETDQTDLIFSRIDAAAL